MDWVSGDKWSREGDERGKKEIEVSGILPQRQKSVLMLKLMTTGKKTHFHFAKLKKNILCSDGTFNHE